MKFLRPDQRLADWVPWLLPLDPDNPEVILTASGGLLRCARIQPPDFETASLEALDRHHEQVAAILARLGNGFTVQFDMWREPSDAYLPGCSFGGNYAAQLIDASRRRCFSNLEQPVFTDRTFLTVHWQPQQQQAFMAWLTDCSEGQEEGHIRYFMEHSNALFSQMRQVMPGVEVLEGDALASYLSASVTYEPGLVRFPADIMSSALASREWHFDDQVRIDQRHMATVEVRNFGRQVDPTTVEALHALPFPARWVMTFDSMDSDQQREEFKKVLGGWRIQKQTLGAMIGALLSKMVGERSEAKPRAEVKTALDSLEALEAWLSKHPFAFAKCNVHVSGETAAEANTKAAIVGLELRAVGIEARTATINAAWALLGDMPGAIGEQVKNPRSAREELAVATCLAPVTGVDDGSPVDWRFNGPALLVGLTMRGGPFNWALNAPGSDLAHTGVVGESGGGKSTFLGLTAAQFTRYDDAGVIFFDRGRSFLVTCLCLGGDWLELGGGGIGVQPLRNIHLPEELAWAQGWVLHALRVQGLQLEDGLHDAVAAALGHVADCPPDQRTLSMLHTYLSGHSKARGALNAYRAGGAYGSLFDGVVDSYGRGNVIGIETQSIEGLQQVEPLVMSAVLRAVNLEHLSGSNPKLVIADELGRAMASSETFASEISDWALALRKRHAVLVLATQSLSHFDGDVASAIWDQLGNKVFMPHAEAMRPESFHRYLAKGLREEQIRALSRAKPKGEILLQTRPVTRMLDVTLTDDALAICGAIGSDHHARAFALRRQGVKPGAEFTREWLRETTAEWFARNKRLQVAA